MRTLRVNTLCGIKNQLYCQEQYVCSEKKKGIFNHCFDINSLFWSRIFDAEHVCELVERAKCELCYIDLPKIQAVLHESKIFLDIVCESLKSFDTAVSDKMLFQSLETLEIVCYLHTKLYSSPYKLTLSQGFVLSDFSALDMEHNCLMPFCNPYLEFINAEVIPEILEYHPEILILTGKPNLAAFAIAKLIKQKIPTTFIIASEHESDYYSLRKISGLLCKNTAFFSVYNCVVLSDNKSTITQIEKWYKDKQNESLNDIADIIYSLDSGKSIIKTISHTSKDEKNNHIYINKLSYVYNIRVFSQNYCYWNKCSFCGINKKYECAKNQKWNVTEACSKINYLYKHGIKRIWLLDEAIPPIIMYNFADNLIHWKIDVIWHVRTRIEPQFVDKKFIKKLSMAGLKHILFGFESATNRILKLMNKNTGNFNYLETAENIVKNFNAEGIQVHFSAILGYPTETKEERHETLDFLYYLHHTYPLFSYNLNLFYLDIGSKMYHRWADFNILALSFPCTPKYYLGNHLDWINSISPEQTDIIYRESEDNMKLQYEWYPEGSLIEPSKFYSFWEYSRYNLYTNDLYSKNELTIDSNRSIILSPYISQCQLKNGLWLLYHLLNHHYVTGGAILLDLIYASNNKESFQTFIQKYHDTYRDKVESLILQLARKEFFI
jgi:hypothetical protein